MMPCFAGTWQGVEKAQNDFFKEVQRKHDLAKPTEKLASVARLFPVARADRIFNRLHSLFSSWLFV